MKDAEREIRKIQFAFDVIEEEKVIEKALIIKQFGKGAEAYHQQI